jgi:hypothetical protein
MQEQKGVSTRLMLVSALMLVIVSVTFSSLLVIGNRMRQQVLKDFSEDLSHSVETFQSFQAQQLAALQRENALLADLPSLKALMTTSDERTIADGAVEFWKVGGNGLYARRARGRGAAVESCRDPHADRQTLPANWGQVVRVLGATALLWQRSGGHVARIRHQWL